MKFKSEIVLSKKKRKKNKIFMKKNTKESEYVSIKKSQKEKSSRFYEKIKSKSR